MDRNLEVDERSFPEILSKTLNQATDFLQSLNQRPVGILPSQAEICLLPERGMGAEKALQEFHNRYASGMTASSGPRYFGFVTGGSTPAAVAGDWLVSVFDQNAIGAADSSAPYIEQETISLLRQLFHLPSHSGTFVSGATMANFVGLALARQWVGQQRGVNVAQDGIYALPPLKILSGSPHSCIFKALAMLGMGKNRLQLVPCLPNREAIDLTKLREYLHSYQDQACIVVANSGTVNTADFDDLVAIVALKQEFNFWLHVDAAFGGFAACSAKYSHFVAGMNTADSVAIDAHKWLNVPYDSAMQFTQHRELQLEVFQNTAAYLDTPSNNPDFVHLTPENSRRLRALPAWMSLMAYGASGYRDIVERNCELAQLLGERIESSTQFKLLAPVRLNIVCFTLAVRELSLDSVKDFLAKLRDNGQVFFTPSVYQEIPAIRAALSNWRTEQMDIEIAWKALLDIAAKTPGVA